MHPYVYLPTPPLIILTTTSSPIETHTHKNPTSSIQITTQTPNSLYTPTLTTPPQPLCLTIKPLATHSQHILIAKTIPTYTLHTNTHLHLEYVVVRRWSWVITGVLLLGGAKGVGACLFMYVFILKCV